jgi:hypothetical protein
MQLQRVNRTDAEKVYITAINVEAETMTTGVGVRYVGGVAGEQVSNTGAQVIRLAAGGAAMAQFAGIAAEDIASLAVGRFQVWGYVNSIMFSANGSSITVGVVDNTEHYLDVGLKGAFTSTKVAATCSTDMFKFVQVWDTVNVSTTEWGVGFVRAI